MKIRTLALTSLIVLAAAAAVEAGPGKALGLRDRLKGAERAVVGRVLHVQPRVVRNEFGDVLIVSRLDVLVEETLKGKSAQRIPVDIEGGTVNGVTLKVSDLPELKPGARAVLMLSRARSGEFVPHMRGAGVLELDEQGHVKNTELWLDDVRVAAAQVR